MPKSNKRNTAPATSGNVIPLPAIKPANDQPRQKSIKLPVLLLDKDQRKNKGTLAEQLRVAVHAEDGKDHVNLSVRAQTHVGRISCIEHRAEFYIPYLGDFDSARAFACWVTTQREEFRFKPPAGQLMGVQPSDYNNLLLFAKYFQMCAMNASYQRNKSLLNLPWVSYTQLELSKIRQYHRWTDYPTTLRSMARHIVNGGMRESPCPYFDPAILKSVNKYLKLIAERQSLPFTPYEEMQGKHRAVKEEAREGQQEVSSAETPQHKPMRYIFAPTGVAGSQNVDPGEDTNASRDAVRPADKTPHQPKATVSPVAGPWAATSRRGERQAALEAARKLAVTLDAEQGITEDDLPPVEKPIDMNELRKFGKELDREFETEVTQSAQPEVPHVQV